MNWADSNLPEQWEKFKRHIELVFSGPLQAKTEQEQVAYLLLWVGEKGRDVHATWSGISEADSKKLKTYYDRFKAHVQPKLNPIFARYKFNNEVQNQDTIDAYITRLRLSARDCNFTNADEMIRDRIVFGTTSSKIREKLINVGAELTLEKAIQIAQSFEYSQQQLRSMAGATGNATTEGIHYVRRPGNTGTIHTQRQRARTRAQPRQHPSANGGNRFQRQPSPSFKQTCGNCGNNHKTGSQNCAAKGKICHACLKPNHFSKFCRSSKNVHALDYDQNSREKDRDLNVEFEEFYIDTVSPSKLDRAFVELNIGPSQTPINFKIDTGSSVNILPLKHFQKLKIVTPLEPPEHKLTSYTGDMLSVNGKITLPCSHKDVKLNSPFYVVENSAPPLISLQTSIDLGLVKLTYSVENLHASMTKQDVLDEYGELFQGIGLFPGKSKLHLKSDAVPVVNPPRRIPEALRDRVKTELHRMENNGIIKKVTEPTDWVNSMHAVEKPKTGKLRIVLDPKYLNDNIRRPHYPMQTLDDVTSRLADAKFFSILDITHAYWSVELDDESSYLTTFSSPFGRWRFLRLPFGIKSSQDIFQQKIDEIFEGLTGITSIVDDILVYGRSRQEHDQNLRVVLERARAKGIRFNLDKLVVGVTEVPFFGHLITSSGLKPDPSKIRAIASLSVPQTRAQLENVLGMVNYLQKFAPNLAEITGPMRALLKNDVEFIWDQPQTDAFEKMKQVITQTPVLAYFDPSKPVTLECDSSKYGAGAALLQDGRPVAFASKTLTTTEQSYAQIEKEMNAIVFACTRFHQYIYGRPVTVHSDHRPLSSIMKKPLSAAPPRLQRMMLQLQKYDIDVQHVSGKDVPISDLLSRQPLSDLQETKGLDLQVHTVLQNLYITDRRLESVRNATLQDSQMQTLKQTILQGWPDLRTDCSKSIIEFWNHRDELSTADDLIFRGQTLVIPKSLRQQMIDSIHTGHMGTQKCLLRAKDVMFWPGMTKQITDFVLECPICLNNRRSNTKEPLTPHEIPKRPWENVASDLFYFDNKDYLITVDYYSRYFEVDALPDTKSSTVIRKLKAHFARMGVPSHFYSDNGPCYTSSLFEEFAKEWNFTHVTSSPLHPISNGLAEKMVGVVKSLFKKAKESGRDPLVAILEYRNTPLDCGFSPNQLLMSRRTRSIQLPMTDEQLKPVTVPSSTVRSKIQKSKYTQKKYYDRSAKPLPSLHLNEYVRLQVGNIWKPAKVINIHDRHSYSVQTKDGGVYRRNRRLLSKTPEKFPEITDFAPLVLLENSQEPVYDSIQINTPQEPLPSHSPATPTKPVPQQTPDSPYLSTRSGRRVKPNSLYFSDKWLNV